MYAHILLGRRPGHTPNNGESLTKTWRRKSWSTETDPYNWKAILLSERNKLLIKDFGTKNGHRPRDIGLSKSKRTNKKWFKLIWYCMVKGQVTITDLIRKWIGYTFRYFYPSITERRYSWKWRKFGSWKVSFRLSREATTKISLVS